MNSFKQIFRDCAAQVTALTKCITECWLLARLAAVANCAKNGAQATFDCRNIIIISKLQRGRRVQVAVFRAVCGGASRKANFISIRLFISVRIYCLFRIISFDYIGRAVALGYIKAPLGGHFKRETGCIRCGGDIKRLLYQSRYGVFCCHGIGRCKRCIFGVIAIICDIFAV